MLASRYDIETRTLNLFTHLRVLSDRRQSQHWGCATITPYRNFGWLVRLELTLPVPQTDVLTINTITTIYYFVIFFLKNLFDSLFREPKFSVKL